MASASANAPEAGKAKASRTNPVTNRATSKRSPAGLRKGTSVVNIPDEEEDQGGAAPTAFLAKKDELNRQVEEEARKMGLKTFIGQVLAGIVKKVNEDQLDQLRKLGDFEGPQKTYEKVAQEFIDLGRSLPDVVQETIDGWEAKLQNAITELSEAAKRGGD